MFGNGQDIQPPVPLATSGAETPSSRLMPEPPSSASLWGDMFGVGNFLKMVTDPTLGQQAAAMMTAIIESSQASRRIETKLNMLLKALGHEVGNIEGGQLFTTLLAANGPDGSGRSPAASQPPNNGVGSAAGTAGGTDGGTGPAER